MKRHPCAVIGLGNLLLQDEGAGTYVTSLLEKKYPGLPVDFIHAGTPGYSLLHQFDERKKIIFIDAGYCEAKPGEYRRFTREEVISKKKSPGYSLHEFDLLSFLSLAEKMDFLVGVDVVIYCIQMGKTDVTGCLSDEVTKGLPQLLSAVYDEIMETLRQLS